MMTRWFVGTVVVWHLVMAFGGMLELKDKVGSGQQDERFWIGFEIAVFGGLVAWGLVMLSVGS